MAQLGSQSADVKQSQNKKIDMGIWLIILFGLVLLFGFALMLVDILL